MAPAVAVAVPEQEQAAGKAAAAEPPPLPLHTIEGTGGAFFVPFAYLVNTPAKGEVLGKPALGYSFTNLGHAKGLSSFTLTEAISDRVELGYGYNYLTVGDLYEDIDQAGMPRPSGHAVKLHNINARFLAVKEGAFDMKWMPALTAGVHYKNNQSLTDLNDDLNGGLYSLTGVEDEEGWDFTLTATKMVTPKEIHFLKHPLIFTLGLRSSEAAHIGLLGFTGKRTLTLEGDICMFLTPQILLSAEYRQKPDEYDRVPGLIENEDDWFALCASYIASDRVNISAGYGHFGDVLNHKANAAFAIAVKLEF